MKGIVPYIKWSKLVALERLLAYHSAPLPHFSRFRRLVMDCIIIINQIASTEFRVALLNEDYVVYADVAMQNTNIV